MSVKSLFLSLFLLSTSHSQDLGLLGDGSRHAQNLEQNPVQVPGGIRLSILAGKSSKEILRRYPNLKFKDIKNFTREMKRAGEITSAERSYLVHSKKPAGVLSGIYKSRKYTHTQLKGISRLSKDVQKVILAILYKKSYDEMQKDDPSKTQQDLFRMVAYLEGSNFIASRDIQYLRPSPVTPKNMDFVRRVNVAVGRILEREPVPTFQMLADETGYTLGSLVTLLSRNIRSGQLKREDFIKFNQQIRSSQEFQEKVNKLIDQVHNKESLQVLLLTMNIQTKLQLNRIFQRLYDEQRLTSEDTAYLKEKVTVVQRRGQTKQQVLDFVTQCCENERYFGMLSSLWDAFNVEGNNGARSIGIRTLGAHYRDLVKLGRISPEIQSYMAIIKGRGELAWNPNTRNSANLH